MSLPRLAPLRLRRDAAGAVRISAAPDRSPLVVRAASALSQLAGQAGAPDAATIDVQPVVQVSDPAGYHRWRSGRERIWRAQGAAYTTAGWPRELAEDRLAALLLPLPYGATDAGGRQAPRVVGGVGPLFSTRSREDGSGAQDIATGLIAEWLRQSTTVGPALRVAPPILDAEGARRVLDLGLAWPLAAAS